MSEINKNAGIIINWTKTGGSIVREAYGDFGVVRPEIAAFTDDVDLMNWLGREICADPNLLQKVPAGINGFSDGPMGEDYAEGKA